MGNRVWVCIRFFLLAEFLFLFYNPLYTQTAQKPSRYFSSEKTKRKKEITYLHSIHTKQEIDQLVRVYNQGTIYEMPHFFFIIDRTDSNRIYYINTSLYDYHLDFMNVFFHKQYTPSDLKVFYTHPNRQYILGTIAFQNLIKMYTYEFWEGDILTDSLLDYTQQTLIKSFHFPLQLKTNSTQQEQIAETAEIRHITQNELIKQSPYRVLNPGKTQGRIRIADSIEHLTKVGEKDIIVLKTVPIAIPAVAGIITERASTLLSHINVLARGLQIPSIYLKEAVSLMEKYEGEWVELTAGIEGYKIRKIKEPSAQRVKITEWVVSTDKERDSLFPLNRIRKADYIYFGSKAANLGEMQGSISQINIPDGFSIPFAQYHAFMNTNGFYEKIRMMEQLPGFQEKPAVRKKELEELRYQIEQGVIDQKQVNTWIQQWKNQLQEKGVFVRSSSNAEDLPGFSGAGLFTTVPNVTTEEELQKAVKKVWASVFNFEAYETRKKAAIPDSLICMSVLVQLAVNSDLSGVMITKDPFNPLRWDLIYIAAKRGIGIKVVEGRKIAEQVIYSERTKAVQLISRSEEETELKLDTAGGVREISLRDSERVMSDKLVARLAEQGRKIKQLFKTDMDIEWAVADNLIIILQARPYK